MLEPLAAAVADTWFALWAARDPWAYPVANVVHVLGLALLLGPILLVDLRLLGAMRQLPLEPLVRALSPFSMVGIVLLAGSGTVLFAADAVALAGSDTFRLKLILVGLGLANALGFRALWKGDDPPGALARTLALASLLLWTATAIAGRWIAYAA
jgi:hypothetical protein